MRIVGSFAAALTWCDRMHAIAGKLSPTQRGGGIELLETDTFRLHCLQTQTCTAHLALVLVLISLHLAALKFFVVAEPSHPSLDAFLLSVYNLYIDFALKVRAALASAPC